MTRNRTMLGVPALLTLALLAPPAPADPPASPGAEREKLDGISRQLDDLKNALDVVQKARADIEALKKDGVQLRQDLEALRKNNGGDKWDAVSAQLTQLRKDLAEFQESGKRDLERARGESTAGINAAEKARADVAELRKEVVQLRHDLEAGRKDEANGKFDALAAKIDDLRRAFMDGQGALARDLDKVRTDLTATAAAAQTARADVEDLKKQMADLRQELDRVRTAAQPPARIANYGPPGTDNPPVREDLRELSRQLERLQADVTSLRLQEPAPPRVATYGPADTSDRIKRSDVEALRQHMDRLQRDLANLSGQPAVRVAGYGPASLGRIRLVNTYPQEMTVVVNGVTYRLAPGESRNLQATAGPFTYQVLGVQPTAQTRELAPDTTFTIDTHPSGS